MIWGTKKMTKTKTIKQTVIFKCSPNDVYEAFMDEKKHSEFIGSKAKINRKEGGKFTIYEGAIDGTNLELVQGKKIVQKWRYEDWPDKHYSTITLILKKDPKGTKMEFIQEGVPEDKYEAIKQGWVDYYWNPMKEMLEK